MEFGSDYAYMYDDVGYEYISDEEVRQGMNVSDSDSDDDIEEEFENPPPPPPRLSGGVTNLYCKSLTPGSNPEPRPRIPVADSSVTSDAPKAPPPPRTKMSHWRSAYRTRDSHSERDSQSAEYQERGYQGHRRVRQGDTNIVTIKFNQLVAPSNMHAGDPEACTNCGAILSKLSKLDVLAEEKVWQCEYCETRNVVDLEEEEIPADLDVTYMLQPALSTTASGPTGLDESLVVFCVDVSGSMCVTTEVPGNVELRGASDLRRSQVLNRQRADQRLPNQRRNVTYISRLQSVQAAIDHQLQEMSKEFPNRRVALVTFSNEVTVIGDGKTDPVSIAGDKLGNKETLRTLANEQPFPGPIKGSRQQLGQKLFDLEECGPTALGPALLVATTMASKVRGSKVILCTDGLANIGMGKLEGHNDEEGLEDAIKFYGEISESAKEKGISISVITIKGTDCKLVELGKMADNTGGQVNIVDPLKLTQEFSTILANKIIATNVVATFILHKQLFFFYEETEDFKVVKNIGNVTADTEISFEYGVKTKPKPENKETSEVKTQDKMETVEEVLNDKEDIDVKTGAPDDSDAVKDEDKMKAADKDKSGDKDKYETTPGTSKQIEGADPFGACAAGQSSTQLDEGRKELPFQLQIVYTDTEGAKALRVITQSKPITHDRKKAEKNAKVDVLARHTAMTSAKMAQEGMYTMSRERALMNQRVAWRHTREADTERQKSSKPAYKKAFGKIKSMENYLAHRQMTERETMGRTYSDDEEDMAAPEPSKEKKSRTKSFFSRRKQKRSDITEDAGAALVFRGKNANAFFESDSDDEGGIAK